MQYDLAIIGGGVNGCGIARDASGRGLSVLLCEQDDLGGATSSASTKLIHGGLRYLEHYAFRLVREALVEREILLENAPHIIRPMRFVLPYHEGLRPWWMLRLGLFLYDHIGGRRRLPATGTLDLRSDVAGEALKSGFTRAFEYSDAWVDDARLVVLNAMDAAGRGADICTRTRCVCARREPGGWRLSLERGGVSRTVTASKLVNAAGPWVAAVRHGIMAEGDPDRIRLVRGSHIVVPRLFGHDRAYIFQNADGRVVFAIPYERDFTLIGTTDEDYHGDPREVRITESEIGYLCSAASAYFREPVTPGMVHWTYSGVRPLYDDGATKAQETTRDYVLDLDAPVGEAPVLHIYGGKITTYRRLAEAALERLGVGGAAWTRRAPLPGGGFAPADVEVRAHELIVAYPFLEFPTALRLVRAYGTRAAEMLGGVRVEEDMGEVLGADLTAREVRYLMRREWAETPEDILWRRTKLGLRFSQEQAAALARFMEQEREAAE